MPRKSPSSKVRMGKKLQRSYPPCAAQVRNPRRPPSLTYQFSAAPSLEPWSSVSGEPRTLPSLGSQCVSLVPLAKCHPLPAHLQNSSHPPATSFYPSRNYFAEPQALNKPAGVSLSRISCSEFFSLKALPNHELYFMQVSLPVTSFYVIVSNFF